MPLVHFAQMPAVLHSASELAAGVKTIAELEVLHFLQQINAGDASTMVIDLRTPDWVEKGTIPWSVNIPWDKLDIGKSDSTAVQGLSCAVLQTITST